MTRHAGFSMFELCPGEVKKRLKALAADPVDAMFSPAPLVP
jgi:hypothetical protein